MEPDSSTAARSHWRALVLRTAVLLALWFAAGPLLGILLADRLNAVSVFGMPVGFWISQQGAIYVFVILIFVNAALAERSDRRRARGGG